MVLTTGVAHAEDTVGIGIAPADTKGKPDGRSRFTYQADPGQTVTDHVRVTNTGSTRIEVTLYAADAYNDEKGDFALADSTEKKSGASSWVTFDGRPKLGLTLKRGESKTVPFTVAIPADAGPGDHPAGIIASAVTGGQVTVERRIADRLYVRVSGNLQPVLTITSFSGVYHSGLNPLDGSISVTATITNSGNVALEGTTTLSATTWFGAAVGRSSRAELPEILPGSTSTVNFDIPGVPQVGFASVRMLLQGGISGDAPDPGPLPVIQRDLLVATIPWAVVGVLMLGGLLWLVLWLRRRREDRYAREWMAHTEAEAAARAADADAQELALAVASGSLNAQRAILPVEPGDSGATWVHSGGPDGLGSS
jgi:Predicted membrane protein